MAVLRKRPNRFVLTELDRDEWPKGLILRERMLELLRPQKDRCSFWPFLLVENWKRYLVPNAKDVIACPAMVDYDRSVSCLFLFDGKTGAFRELGPLSGEVRSIVMQTTNGWIVVSLFSRYEAKVVCVKEDGTEQWRFAPDLPSYHDIKHIHTSKQGIVTLSAVRPLAKTEESEGKNEILIWQIDGETGKILRERSFPFEKDGCGVIYSDRLNAFLMKWDHSSEFILLNERLEEIQRIKGPQGFGRLKEDVLCSTVLWTIDFQLRNLSILDLKSGESRDVRLEIPSYVMTVLPDERILGIDEKGKKLFVYGRDGALSARCSFPGVLRSAFMETGVVYLVELRPPENKKLSDMTSFEEMIPHVWRLDPVPEP